MRVFAFIQEPGNPNNGEPVTGDAANITCGWSIDLAAPVNLADTNPTEESAGFYYFNLTQAETNGSEFGPIPVSSTPGVRVIPASFVRYSRAAGSGGSSGGGYSSSRVCVPTSFPARWSLTAGPITGDNFLIDRLNYDSATKVWPVTTAVMKNHIQLDHSSDDALVEEYIAAATEDAENRGNKALILQKRTQTIGWDLICGGLSGTQVCLSVGPAVGIIAVRYLAEDGVSEVLSTDNYRLMPDKDNIYFFGTLPTFIEGPGSVWVDYEAGYGDTPADVPAAWRSIVCQLASRKYDFRGGDTGPTNDSFERMLDRMIVAAGGSRRG